jgi:hypothetical protein
MSEVSAEMPRYKCHKEVHALKINAVIENDKDDSLELHFADEGYAPIRVIHFIETQKFLDLDDNDLGYLVVYPDGYRSWSPTEAFEEGYTRL